MIILLGASGYVGQSLRRAMERRSTPGRLLSRGEVDYTIADDLRNFLRRERPSFVINAAGYTGRERA